MSKKLLLLIIFMCILAGGIGFYIYGKTTNHQMSFEECSRQYGATKSYPGTCTTPDGQKIIQPVK